LGAGCGGHDIVEKTKRHVADGEVVWSWRPDAGVKPVDDDPQATVAKEPGHRGEHEISCKPLRGECRLIAVYLW
jgi:hypothetical protein